MKATTAWTLTPRGRVRRLMLLWQAHEFWVLDALVAEMVGDVRRWRHALMKAREVRQEAERWRAPLLAAEAAACS